MFEHDVPNVAAHLLSPDDMNQNLCIHFLGCKGEFDALMKKTLDSKSTDRQFTKKSKIEEPGGAIISNVDAFNGVHESTGRVCLHFHLCLWGCISLSVLQGGVNIQVV